MTLVESCIREGLLRILGESGLQMVLRTCPLSTFAANPARLHKELKLVFMEGGAAIIEREIGRRLLEGVSQDEAERHSAHFPTLGYSKSSWFPTLGFSGSSGRISKSERKTIEAFLSLTQPSPAGANAGSNEQLQTITV